MNQQLGLLNQLPGQIKILFRYCFEVENVLRKEDSCIIEIKPLRIVQQIIAIYSRDIILRALEAENISRQNILALKYYEVDFQAWMEVPNEISIKLSQSQTQNINSISQNSQIVDLFIRVGSENRNSRRPSQSARVQNTSLPIPTFNQPAISNIAFDTNSLALALRSIENNEPPPIYQPPPPKIISEEIKRITELESEVNRLKEKLESLEKKLDSQDKPSKLIPHSRESSDLAQELGMLPYLTKDFSSIHPDIQNQSLRQRLGHDYLCHQCHSDILKDTHALIHQVLQRHSSHASDSRGLIKIPQNVAVVPEIKQKINSSRRSESGDSKIHDKNPGIQGKKTARNYSHQDSSTILQEEEGGDQESQFSASDTEREPNNYRNDNWSPDFKQNQGTFQKSQKKRRLDLVYLYADPLVARGPSALYSLSAPLDPGSEFRQMQQSLRNNRKQFVMRKDAANFEMLKQILAAQPTVIHISCHGDYDEKLKQYYLAFEEKDSGILDKLTQSRLVHLLGEESNNTVKLVFVSACHSEMIGNIFLNANIPVVVAVNSHTMILDEVCVLFSRNFYFHLQKGFTPMLAFEKARQVVKGSNIDTFSCCCAHSHKPNCRWEKFAKKYGYEKAHNIHMPNCNCANKQNNSHGSNCEIYQEFNKSLREFENLKSLDIDDFNLPTMGSNVTICCCQPNLPHNESIKFLIKGASQEVLDTPIFKNMPEGQLIIDQDVNEKNKLEHIIDTQMLVGRNQELQKIVSYLFSDKPECRLIHIYGQEGLGKSVISNYAAKYVLERRKFQDGVYFIEIQNKNSGQGLISKICSKLLISNCNKEQLCDKIKNSQILILIDKCQKILEHGKESFNKILKYLVKNTMNCKFMVISYKQNDILEKFKFKTSVEIGNLQRIDAARLLLQAASNSPHLSKFKTPNDLAKHKIFDMMKCYKPIGIIQMAPLLYEKSLDQIVNEKESQMLQSELYASIDEQSKIKNLDFGEFSWIMSITYRDLQAKYQSELNLLHLMCQFPSGLFISDIEYICAAQQYGSWKVFLDQISQDSKASQTEEKQQSGKKKRIFRMITSNYNEDLLEVHYIAQPIVYEYINKLVLNQKVQTGYFQENLKYISKLSRKLLRSLKMQNKNDIDLNSVSCEIDLGLWTDSYTNIPLTEQELEVFMVYKPEIKFNFYESNFIGYLDLEQLKIHFQKLDHKSSFCQHIDELCNNITSILIKLDRLDEAKSIIERTEEIANYFDLKFIKAKSYTILGSIRLKQNLPYSDIQVLLEKAEKIFIDLDFKDGVADVMFLKALALMQSINNRLTHHDNNLEYYSQSLAPHNFERSNSQSVQNERLSSKHLQLKNRQVSQNISTMNAQQLTRQLINQEIQGVLSNFHNSRKFFKLADLEYGIAKVNLIEAEFQIEKSFGSGLSIEFLPKKLQDLLVEALKIFKKFRYDSLQVRCLRNLALLKLRMGDHYEAKMNIDEALTLAKKIQDNNQEGICSDLLNQILEKIRINSNNVFIFVKAFPLVEVLKDNIRVVGTFTRYPQDFRKKVFQEVKKINKVVNLRFDCLSRDLLYYIRDYGCRVLHLSSDVFHAEYLCIEGKNSQIDYISISELKSILKPANSKLNVDVVVLAIPESERLAQAFYDIGVPHVVYFDFQKKLLSTFMDNLYTLPKRYEYIYDFSVAFYKNLINEHSIQKAWIKAKPKLTESIRKVSTQFSHIKLTAEDVGEGAILFPRDKKHQEKLFDSHSFDDNQILQPGQFIDTSNVRGPTNIFSNKPQTPYTGRQIDTYKLISNLKKRNVKIVNIVGLDGIGKTRFVQETAYYLSARFEFQDGIFLLDLRRVKTAEQIKQKLKELNIGGVSNQELNSELQKKNILLIFDNIDTIVKFNKAQFDWFLISLVQSSDTLKVVLTSKKEIKAKDYQCIEKNIFFFKMKPLNDIEAVDMILSYCQREITLEELQLSSDSRQSIHNQLQQEASVKKCYGFPKYLEFFANYLNTHSFDKIDIKNYIPNSKKGQMKRLQKEHGCPKDFRSQKQSGKAGATEVYKEYKDPGLSSRKQKYHPDTIEEVEEEKEMMESSGQPKKSFKVKRMEEIEEEKVIPHPFDPASNDQLMLGQFDDPDYFYDQSRRGSNMTKKYNSSSGGDDYDSTAQVYIAGDSKWHHKKFNHFGQQRGSHQQQTNSLFVSEMIPNRSRKESRAQDDDFIRQDSLQQVNLDLLNNFLAQSQQDNNQYDLLNEPQHLQLYFPKLQAQISTSTYQNQEENEIRSRSNSEFYASQAQMSQHRNSINKNEKHQISANFRQALESQLTTPQQNQNSRLALEIEQFGKEYCMDAESIEENLDDEDYKNNEDNQLSKYDADFAFTTNANSGSNKLNFSFMPKQNSYNSRNALSDERNTLGDGQTTSSCFEDEDEVENLAEVMEENDDSNSYNESQSQASDQPSFRSMQRQQSYFNTSSTGKRSSAGNSSGSMSSLNLSKRMKTKKELEAIQEKKKRRQEQGPNSGKHAKKFGKTTKNKYQENLLEKKKSKKQKDQELREGATFKHMESGKFDMMSPTLIEEKSIEDDSSNSNYQNSSINQKQQAKKKNQPSKKKRTLDSFEEQNI